MTDPNMPPPRDDRPEVVHHTTINNPPASSGGGGSGWIGFLVGGIAVELIIIAVVMFSNGGLNAAKDTNVDVDVDLPTPTLPDAPKMPDLPEVQPPSLPNPEPAPAN